MPIRCRVGGDDRPLGSKEVGEWQAGLFGEEYTKRELLDWVGNISKLSGVEMAELTRGKKRGREDRPDMNRKRTGFRREHKQGDGDRCLSLFRDGSFMDVAPCNYELFANGLDRNSASGLMHNAGLRQVGTP